MSRTILHVDMDAFYAAVEQRDHPEYRGRPVIVGAPPDRRGVVAAASYEARVYGVRSAMPSRVAGRLCPNGVFVPVNGERYAEVSGQVFAIFGRFTPLVEPLSIDEAFLDVTGARALFGDGETIARRIKQAVKSELDLTCSVGVATNKFLAKLASEMHKPDGLTVVPTTREGIVAFLAPLPIGRLWGVGKATESGLEAAGIRTIGDIQALSDSRLAALVGRHAADHFRRLAFGEDDRVVEPDVEEKSISRETTFAQDCRDPAAVEREYVALVADVAQRLRKQGKRAQLVRLKLRWADFRTLTRQKPLSVPCCDDFTLQAAAKELLDSEPLVHAVRLIGFGVSRLTDEAPPQPDLFAETDRRRERLEAVSHTLDSLRARLGDACIRRGTPSPPRPKADGRTENGKRNE